MINFISFLLWLILVLIVLLSVSSYFQRTNHFFDNASHFKLQYIIISLVCSFSLLLLRSEYGFLVGLFATAVNSPEVILWYFPQFSERVESLSADQQICIFQANVQHNNDKHLQVVEQVCQENPDLAIFLEVTQDWITDLEKLRAFYPYSFSHLEPYCIKPPLWYEQETITEMGCAIYSKFPLEEKLTESFGGGGRKTAVMKVKLPRQVIHLLIAHPTYPFKRNNFELRNRQLAEIGNYIQTLPHPVVVVGDLNTTMWSSYYKKFVQHAEFKNTRKGFGVLPTFGIIKAWASTIPWLKFSNSIFLLLPSAPFDLPLDHCLVSLSIKVLKTHLGKRIGSDHLPLISNLAVPAPVPSEKLLSEKDKSNKELHRKKLNI